MFYNPHPSCTNIIVMITVKLEVSTIIMLPCNYSHKYQKLFFQYIPNKKKNKRKHQF